MKYIILLLVLVVTSCKTDNGFVKAVHIPSKLDSLDKADIEGLVHRADTNYQHFRLKPFYNYYEHGRYGTDSVLKQAAKRYKMDKSIYRADFDNNGYDDILALGDMNWCKDTAFCSAITFVIMNFGRDSVNVFPLYNKPYLNHPEFPQIVTDKDTVPLIVAHNFNYLRQDVPSLLIYKNGGFVEYTNNKTFHDVEKVQFVSGPCFGDCPVFQIEFTKNYTANLLAIHYNFKKGDYKGEEGFYTTTLKKKDVDNIISILDYINFEMLQNYYGVTWTDDRDAKLIITYDGGKTKTIHDYGLNGSYGLRLLYKHLHDLRFNQKWKKVKEPKGYRIEPFNK